MQRLLETRNIQALIHIMRVVRFFPRAGQSCTTTSQSGSAALPLRHNRIDHHRESLHLLLDRRARDDRVHVAPHVHGQIRPARQDPGGPRAVVDTSRGGVQIGRDGGAAISAL
jgi:hypothetical protein